MAQDKRAQMQADVEEMTAQVAQLQARSAELQQHNSRLQQGLSEQRARGHFVMRCGDCADGGRVPDSALTTTAACDVLIH